MECLALAGALRGGHRKSRHGGADCLRTLHPLVTYIDAPLSKALQGVLSHSPDQPPHSFNFLIGCEE